MRSNKDKNEARQVRGLGGGVGAGERDLRVDETSDSSPDVSGPQVPPLGDCPHLCDLLTCVKVTLTFLAFSFSICHKSGQIRGFLRTLSESEQQANMLGNPVRVNELLRAGVHCMRGCACEMYTELRGFARIMGFSSGACHLF